ncbi:MAG: Crp/Fnr family transcriptional regulator [Burkholderiales bacterium]
MKHHTVVQKDKVFERYTPVTHVDFPLFGVVSLVLVMKDGASTEVGIVGNEGVAGLSLLMGASTQGPLEAFYQVPGETLRMSARTFRQEIARRGRFEEVLRRYAHGFFNQVAQSTACNHVHAVEQRLCRWLLMCHDRVGVDTIRLTQEFLAEMLGVRRASVNIAAAILQRAGYIRYSRGAIEVLDRPGLEASSCECYAVVRKDLEGLLG